MFPIRRAKQQSVRMDWGDLIKQINDRGVTYAQISEFTGVNLSVANALANDLRTTQEEWDKAAALIDLWLMVRDENARKPVIGA
ncbi:MAG: hypothetical protein ACXWAT_00665 [Methylobacter sp.]